MGTIPGKQNALSPIQSIIQVTQAGIHKIDPAMVTVETVGVKTYGLASIPSSWTLPFISISPKLYEIYCSGTIEKTQLIADWSELIKTALTQIGILAGDSVLIRSSGCTEGINKRGRFHTVEGLLQHLDDCLTKCLNKLALDSELKNESVPLLVQKQCFPVKSKGHLSNERRCYEDKRDWIGENESISSEQAHHFQINLRHWREKVITNPDTPLLCSLSRCVPETLKVPADWAYRKEARVHFEWVWNGNRVYVVQADEEFASDETGQNQILQVRLKQYSSVVFEPQCLRKVVESDAQHFSKINNVFIYLRLSLPTAPLYILDDRKIIAELCNGTIPNDLRADISELVKGSLVIRTDIATTNLQRKQLLPRTQEVRCAEEAFTWLLEQSKIISDINAECAFIFHNFIPAKASAFAYADPKSPFVGLLRKNGQ